MPRPQNAATNLQDATISKSESPGFTGLGTILGRFQNQNPSVKCALGRFVGRFHSSGTISFSQSLGKMRLGTISFKNLTLMFSCLGFEFDHASRFTFHVSVRFR